MESLDQNRLNRVWDRVASRESPEPAAAPKPDLQELTALLRRCARDCHQLCRIQRGRSGALLQRMSRQLWEYYRALQQLTGQQE